MIGIGVSDGVLGWVMGIWDGHLGWSGQCGFSGLVMRYEVLAHRLSGAGWWRVRWWAMGCEGWVMGTQAWGNG